MKDTHTYTHTQEQVNWENPNEIIELHQCQYPGCYTIVFQNVNTGRTG